MGVRAQRRPESELRRHAQCLRAVCDIYSALNEGRSLNSGDTVQRLQQRLGLADRSTKAGV